MSYVSNCCGKNVGYYSNAFIPLSNGEMEGWYCPECRKPTTPVEQKSGGEEEGTDGE